MTATVIVDELHVTVRVPAGLSGPEVEAVRRVLDGDAFPDRLRDAVEAAVREFPELAPIVVTVSR